MAILQNILKEIWLVTVAMAPYLLFGFLMAGVLSVLISKEYVRRHLGGRVAVGDAAEHGAPRANGPVCDPRHGLGDQRCVFCHQLRGVRLLVADQCAQRHRAGVDRDVGKSGNAADVDHVLRASHSQPHQRDQALPAGENLGVVAVLGE